MTRIWFVILSVLLTAALFGSAERAIDKIQEARIAETAREMVVSGQWVVPYQNGELRLQKPPFTYWTTALSYQLFGVSELSTRIPSLLFGVLSVMVLWRWLTHTLSPTAALATIWVLVTSFLGMRYLRSGEADVTLMFFIILASYSAYQIAENASPNKAVWVMLSALGLGFFTKGPAGVAIPLLTLVLYTWRFNKLERLRLLANGPAWIAFGIFAFGWYLWILFNLPEAASMFWSKQVDETFVSGTHKQPVYWYLAHAIEFFAPWSLLLIPAAIWLKQNSAKPAIVQFSICWLVVVFVLLTLTVNKQTQYALLFLPPLAILLGYYIDKATGRYQWLNRLLAGLFGVAVLLIVAVVIRKHGWGVFALHKELIIVFIPLVLGWMLKLSKYNFTLLVIAVFSVFNFLLMAQYLSKDAETDDIKVLMQTAKKRQALYQLKPGNGVVSFYAERVIPVRDIEQLEHGIKEDGIHWVVSKDKPEIVDVKAEVEKTAGKWNLWKLSRQ